MKQTWKEKRISKFIKLGNKYRFLKLLMLFMILLVSVMDGIGKYFMNNRKRLVAVCVSFLVFFITNSFSTPAFTGNPDGTSEVIEEALEERLAEEETLLQEEAAAVSEEEDKYSVDEILNNSNSQEIINSVTESDNKNFSKDDWNLLLVNKQHPVPEDYTFELGTITASMKCDARILPELFAMLQAARDEGINLAVCSPYRDISKQDDLFERKIRLYMSRGDSYMEAYKKSSQVVTVPGASEHQIGLALDIISDNYTSLDEGFEDTAAGKWLKANCQDYGFILRYPKGKEHITSIIYEPWHFRYVGKEAAAIIMEQEITLEEFVESISE